MSKWLSRKLALVVGGSGLISVLPVIYKKAEVSDTLSLLVVGTLTSIILWYLKINKDLKVTETVSDIAELK